MNGSHIWAALIGAMAMAIFLVVVPAILDWRYPERGWSRKYRAMRADISRLKTKGTR